MRGDVLRRARARRRLTQDEVVEAIRSRGGTCSRVTYSRWENSHAEPRELRTIVALERVLRVRAAMLVDEAAA